MARVVSNYSAVLTNTSYIFDRPSADGDKTQYDYGQELVLPADYGSRETDGFYPVIYPESGWVYFHVVGSITPNYTTVTDPCTAPTSVTLSGKTLTISGGAGGDLNTFQGYHVSWRDANIGTTSYGSWSSDVTVSSSNTTVTYAVSAPAGKVRQFRARTIGSAGSSYYSSYVTCGTTLAGNTAPRNPSIVFPTSGKSTHSATPVVKVNCPADPEGNTMTLYRKVDNGSWTSIGTLTSGDKLDILPSLSNGSHTIYYKLADSYGLESGTVSVAITKLALTWTRAIATGTVISNNTISHKADITQMLNVLNTQCGWYGKSTVALTGTLGRFGDWKAQMQQFESAIKTNATAVGKTISFGTVPGYPTASVINEIRTQLLAF